MPNSDLRVPWTEGSPAGSKQHEFSSCFFSQTGAMDNWPSQGKGHSGARLTKSVIPTPWHTQKIAVGYRTAQKIVPLLKVQNNFKLHVFHPAVLMWFFFLPSVLWIDALCWAEWIMHCGTWQIWALHEWQYWNASLDLIKITPNFTCFKYVKPHMQFRAVMTAMAMTVAMVSPISSSPLVRFHSAAHLIIRESSEKHRLCICGHIIILVMLFRFMFQLVNFVFWWGHTCVLAAAALLTRLLLLL